MSSFRTAIKLLLHLQLSSSDSAAHNLDKHHFPIDTNFDINHDGPITPNKTLWLKWGRTCFPGCEISHGTTTQRKVFRAYLTSLLYNPSRGPDRPRKLCHDGGYYNHLSPKYETQTLTSTFNVLLTVHSDISYNNNQQDALFSINLFQ